MGTNGLALMFSPLGVDTFLHIKDEFIYFFGMREMSELSTAGQSRRGGEGRSLGTSPAPTLAGPRAREQMQA